MSRVLSEKKAIARLANRLDQLSEIADAMELLLPNGAEAGCIIKGIANDLRHLYLSKDSDHA
jgi:hypothetical protein